LSLSLALAFASLQREAAQKGGRLSVTPLNGKNEMTDPRPSRNGILLSAGLGILAAVVLVSLVYLLR